MGDTYFSLVLRVVLPFSEARALVERAGVAPPCALGAGAGLLADLVNLCPRAIAGAADLAFLSRPVRAESLAISLAGLSAGQGEGSEHAGGPYRSAGAGALSLLVLRASGSAPLALYGLLSVGAARPMGKERLRALCAALARVPGGSAALWWDCVPRSASEVLVPRLWREVDHWGG
jgi:hypothetical protein